MNIIPLVIDTDRVDVFHFEILQILMCNQTPGVFGIFDYFIGQITFIE